MIKKIISSAAMMSALAVAAPASATVYQMSLQDGTKVSINTDTAIGTWVGNGVNATFSGAGLANFSIDPTSVLNIPSFMTNISITPGSTIVSNGTTYFANTTHQQMFEAGAAAGGANALNLWSYWGTAACPNCTYLGDKTGTVAGARSYENPPSVPEPGMVGLLGLGVLGMAFARRRRVKVNLNMAPALA